MNESDLSAMGCQGTSSTALENGHQIATAQAVLFGFDGRYTNTAAGTVYIMVFDKASAPVSGTDIPKIVVAVTTAATTPTSGNFGYTIPGAYGQKFVNGIYILGSTTDFAGNTFTAIASNLLFFHVQWAPEDGLTSM